MASLLALSAHIGRWATACQVGILSNHAERFSFERAAGGEQNVTSRAQSLLRFFGATVSKV